MKTEQQIRDEAEFQLGCAQMWDTIAAWPLQGRAPLDATLRAVAHRECARALQRRIRVRNWVFWGFVCASLTVMLVLVLDGLL